MRRLSWESVRVRESSSTAAVVRAWRASERRGPYCCASRPLYGPPLAAFSCVGPNVLTLPARACVEHISRPLH